MDNPAGRLWSSKVGYVRPAESVLRSIAAGQDGTVTVLQAYEAGLSRQQLRTLLAHGWTSPVRGVLVQPQPSDPFRAGVRAALLASPDAVACEITAGRLLDLRGLPLWTPAEHPRLLVPSGVKRSQRRGVRTRAGLREKERFTWQGWPVTSLSCTVGDLTRTLPFDDLVYLLDGVLHDGDSIELHGFSSRVRSRLAQALALADSRAESALETAVRLVLVRAGLAPETLQHRLFNADGFCYARVDLAWPSRKVAIEADGRAYHDLPEALHRDRWRQNQLEADGWTVFRFTWRDVIEHPEEIVRRVAAALGRPLG